VSFGAQDRIERLRKLGGTDYDLLVVGGGITGVATARDAVMRGFKVACVEKEDFAYGTSSRSSKLIHGGLRYLEQANFRLVFEGTQERATLRRVAPHLVRPIKFLVPVYESSKHGVLTLGVGLWMYDQLAGKRRYGRHSRHKAEALLKKEPALREDGLRGGAIYYDCMTDDARLCVENAVSAHDQGATMLNRVEFVRPLRDEDGRISGGVVCDRVSGEEVEVSCRVLINCTGPWTDSVLARCGDETGMIRTSKGIHVLFPHDKLPVNHAVVMAAQRDRRVLFAIPRGRVTLVGTTDTDYGGDPDNVYATSEDVDYLLETVAHYFPDHEPGRADIVATYAGLRPLVRDDAESPYDVSREHTVVATEDGTITIGGGKLTTYRRMASDVVTEAMKTLGVKRKDRPKCPTPNAPLPGAVEFRAAAVVTAAIEALVTGGMDQDMAAHLVGVYGARHEAIAADPGGRIIDGMPFCWAEVDHAVREESAMSLADLLIRRLPIFYEAADQGLEVAEAVADRMGALLGWDSTQRDEELEKYGATVAQSRQWKGRADAKV